MADNIITLGIAQKRGAQVFSDKDKIITIAPEVKNKVFERDSHVCKYCGFQAEKYQDVLTLDGNPENHQLDNLATTCIFCHQSFDLEKVSQMRSGVLVWLPEISQTQLHHMARAIYVARISQGAMAETAKKTLEILMNRREEANNRIHTDDPQVLALVMRDFLGPKTYQMRDKKLEGVRLFPLDRRIIKEGDLEFNQFPQILAYWRSKAGPFGGKVPAQWKNFYAQISSGGHQAA